VGRVLTLAALGVAGHTVVNARLLRAPPGDPPPVAERVSLLLPVRDEAHRVEPCVRALLAQQRLRDVELLVLDDGSTDGTGDTLRRLGVEPLAGTAPPPGWLGKPWACHQLAQRARGEVLVFLDADVVLAPLAVAATVALLRDTGLDLVSPYPRQLAGTPAERLVQPLLQWSWLAFLPLRVAERSPRPSLAAANGQLLAVDAGAYAAAGGHGAVRGDVVEDVALLRALKRAGGRGAVADGTAIASCRMYDGWAALRDGYTKSLWTVPAPALAVLAALYLRRDPWAYAAGVASRVVAARRTGGRACPDALAHPAAVAVLLALAVRSRAARRAGVLTWKGRPVPG
jgi:hypothetical protein